jgi:putative tryptophan/tyrosine transport system substrate-binding protein
MHRRIFLVVLGGAAAWPIATRAQQSERVRRIGVLMPLAADDPEAQMRFAAFAQGLERLGRTIGRNIRIETRWTVGDPERTRSGVVELLALELGHYDERRALYRSYLWSSPIPLALALSPI